MVDLKNNLAFNKHPENVRLKMDLSADLNL